MFPERKDMIFDVFDSCLNFKICRDIPNQKCKRNIFMNKFTDIIVDMTLVILPNMHF